MTKVDYEAYRGDTITVAVWVPNADLTGATMKATLKRKLDDLPDDSKALWKKDYSCDDTDVCDDPSSGVAYIRIPGDEDSPDGSTYSLKPNRVYVLDAEFNLAGHPEGGGRR